MAAAVANTRFRSNPLATANAAPRQRQAPQQGQFASQTNTYSHLHS
jgi:hypothetical protein